MEDSLRGKHVLVTGGAGFLGSRIVARIQSASCAKIFAPRSRDYDLVDGSSVRRLFSDFKPDVVIHAAAVAGGIGANSASPGRFFYDNLMMGAQCMEEARRSGVTKFVAVGTICAYPKHTLIPFHETDLWNGYPEETNAPYGLAKKMLLVQAQAYRRQYGFNAIYLLPVNLYGPGDNFDPARSHVIPALIRKCVEAVRNEKDEVELWGTGKVTREFLYVDDCADAIVLATQCYDGPEPVNIGSGREVSIKELAEIIARYTGFIGRFRWDATKPDGQPRRLVDSSRAVDRFSFVARTTLEEGLYRTVDAFRSM